MRTSRLVGEGRSFYHCMSRVVDKQFIFDEKEKEYFRKTMRKLEAFLGVKVLTYCIMSNHFHILLEVPDPESVPAITKDELLNDLLPVLYSKFTILGVKQELERAENDEKWTQHILERYQQRMGKLDVFMKELKQRFTQWYNRNNNRRGTLWEDRYKSVLIEGRENALITMAAYIDLNPVRAGMVDDPKDYRWCGYGDAIGGSGIARRGLGGILHEVLHGELFQVGWEKTQNRYRTILYAEGEECGTHEETGKPIRRGFDQKRVETVLAEKGKLSRAEVLRCRVRYFCDGAVFGSVEFVNQVFENNRSRYGPKRKTGARKMRHADWGELRVFRDLRKDVIQSPDRGG